MPLPLLSRPPVREHLRPMRTLVAIACTCALLAACGGGNDDGSGSAEVGTSGQFLGRVGPTLDTQPVAAPASQRISGLAWLDAPVAGARVELRAPGGELLAQALSDENGSFVLELPPELPRDFVVTAVGGTAAGQPVRGMLLLVQDDFATLDAGAVTTVLTTLAARVLHAGLERDAAYTPAQAAAAVRAYLDLPAGYDLRHRDARAFDVNAFLRALGDVSLDAGLQQLAARIVADPTLTRPYHGVLLGNSLVEDAAIAIGTSVARRGLDYLGRFDHPVTEKISSWGMALVNWAKPDWGARFDRIDTKLDEMKHELGSIQNQLSLLQARMNANSKRIEDALAALSDRADMLSLRNNYVSLGNNIAAASATVGALQGRYDRLLNSPSHPAADRLMDDLASDINSKVPEAILLLRNVQTGTNSPMTSAIDIWYRLQAIATPEYPLSVGGDFFAAINDQQDYVAALQLQALNLLLEAENYWATRNNTAKSLEELVQGVSPYARQIYDKHAADIEAAQALVRYPRMDPGLTANLQSGRLFVRHAAAFWLQDGCTRLELSWSEYGRAGMRALQVPSVDCNFRFANATAAFNAMQPFGHTDWSVAEMPSFTRKRGRSYLVGAQQLGYDFSAAFSRGSVANDGAVFGIQDDFPLLTWNFQSDGSAYMTDKLTSLVQLPPSTAGYNVFFSRPLTPDPLAKSCVWENTGQTVRCQFI